MTGDKDDGNPDAGVILKIEEKLPIPAEGKP
jgi:hypothetical protein